MTARRINREDHFSPLAREIGHKGIGGCIWITLTVNHALRELIETSEGANPAAQQTNCDHIDFRSRSCQSPLPQFTRGRKPFAMCIDCVDDLGYSLTSRGNGLQHRRCPTILTTPRSRPRTKA